MVNLYLQGDGGTWTMSQDTDVPTGQGFAKSLKLDCTTADASLQQAEVDYIFLIKILKVKIYNI
jgi:hypothetical protein